MITDWDEAYKNGAYIADGDLYPARWAAAAAAFRAATLAQGRARLDLPYGPDPRHRADLFLPAGPSLGLAVFVHGGYWLETDKSIWSHLAAGALARGWSVLLPSYRLAPQVRIPEITRDVAGAIAFGAGLVAGPICLAGHSAGGHLVSRMLCADSPLPPAVADRLRRVLSISGLHDLRPLQHTSMCAALQLDGPDAAAESPALLLPKPGARLQLAVGADERPEFLRQSALLANIWYGLGAETALQTIPGRHHYDICDGLTDPDSLLTESLVGGNGAEGLQKGP
ncbi:alpha/beta hydrolase [Phaeovulum sp. W22_SRMD_FR3]|uniref:alpha/beta hydrolase n=1 Tax=Phaeovulum sp. W22_SRMD_FR3 TaxID=3240274 RepID=UPI003F9DC50E